MIAPALDALALRLAELGLSAPAVFFLEAHKPLTGMLWHCTEAFEPIIRLLAGPARTELLQQALRDPEQLEYLIRRIEACGRGADHGS